MVDYLVPRNDQIFFMVNGSIFFVFQLDPIRIANMSKTVITTKQAALARLFVFITVIYFVAPLNRREDDKRATHGTEG